MPHRWRKVVFGTAVAAVLAFMIAVPTIHGISTWKYVLAAIGVVLIVIGGRQ
jgi:hypothetical protein